MIGQGAEDAFASNSGAQAHNIFPVSRTKDFTEVSGRKVRKGSEASGTCKGEKRTTFIVLLVVTALTVKTHHFAKHGMAYRVHLCLELL